MRLKIPAQRSALLLPHLVAAPPWGSARASDITFAASLKNAPDDATNAMRSRPGTRSQSATPPPALAKQTEAGALADIFSPTD
jgi:hypothetical protein